MSELLILLKWLIYAIAAYIGLTVAIPLLFIILVIFIIIGFLALTIILTTIFWIKEQIKFCRWFKK